MALSAQLAYCSEYVECIRKVDMGQKRRVDQILTDAYRRRHFPFRKHCRITATACFLKVHEQSTPSSEKQTNTRVLDACIHTHSCALARYQIGPPTLIAVLAAPAFRTVTKVCVPPIFTLTAVLTQTLVAEVLLRWTA